VTDLKESTICLPDSTTDRYFGEPQLNFSSKTGLKTAAQPPKRFISKKQEPVQRFLKGWRFRQRCSYF
jgi:hypothetical protein